MNPDAPTPPHLPAEPARRSNEAWLNDLRDDGADGLDAQRALCDVLRRGLSRAMGKREGLDDATLDDVTQDAMIRILDRLESFRGDSRFTTWAMSIAIRVAYTTLRRRRWGNRSLADLGVTVDALVPTSTTTQANPASSSDRGDLLEALRAAIDCDLTARQRAAVLGEMAGMPTAVLAQQLNTNANALYKLHHDARRRLKDALHQRGFSDTDVRSILHGASNG
jgi:RNA polymerase sigma-70 factor (ECF subfamily)